MPRPRPAPRIWAADRGDPSSCSPAGWSLLGTPRHGASCARAAARAPPGRRRRRRRRARGARPRRLAALGARGRGRGAQRRRVRRGRVPGAAGTRSTPPPGAGGLQRRPSPGRVAPAPAVCLADGAWGSCAVTRLPGALPLQGVASLRVADAPWRARTCVGPPLRSFRSLRRRVQRLVRAWAPGRGRRRRGARRRRRRRLGGFGERRVDRRRAPAPRGSAGASVPAVFSARRSLLLSAASSTLWIVSPSVSVADKSTIRVAGGGRGRRPAGSGFLSVRGGGSVRVLPAPPRRRVVRVQRGDRPRGRGRLAGRDGAGALTVTGRGEDAGSLTVGDEDEADSLVSEAAPATSSSIVAGRLVLDRFGAVRVRRGGAVRATSYVTDETQDDAQCSSTRCPAYVFGEEEESSGFIFSNSAGEALGREALAADERFRARPAPCRPSPCSCATAARWTSTAERGRASAVHVYGVGEVRVGRGALRGRCGVRARARARQASPAARRRRRCGGAADRFTPDGSGSVLTYSNGTIARGGAAYGDAAPCAASAARGGSGQRRRRRRLRRLRRRRRRLLVVGAARRPRRR